MSTFDTPDCVLGNLCPSHDYAGHLREYNHNSRTSRTTTTEGVLLVALRLQDALRRVSEFGPGAIFARLKPLLEQTIFDDPEHGLARLYIEKELQRLIGGTK